MGTTNLAPWGEIMCAFMICPLYFTQTGPRPTDTDPGSALVAALVCVHSISWMALSMCLLVCVFVHVPRRGLP